MQTSTPQRARRAPSRRSKPLPHPELPEVGNPHFSVAWYLRKLSEHEALQSCLQAQFGKRRNNETLTFALASAIGKLEHDIQEAATRVLNEGLLLLAHTDTTVLVEVPA